MNRNEGIDLLRILAMCMVVMLHTLTASGILAEEATSIYYKSGWFVEIIAFCAVNCYGLISGYVAGDNINSLRKLKKTWFLALFYSVSLTLVYFAVVKTFAIKSLIKAFFPVIFDQWWYFTAFFCMSLFAPYINKVFSDIEEKDCRRIFWAIILIFTVFSYRNTRMVVSAYSVLWIICLYVLGKCIKKGNIFKHEGKLLWLVLYGVLVCLTWFIKIYAPSINIVTYTSPTILFCGISLLLAFKGIKLPNKFKNIVTGPLAQTNFSIYLIHAHPLMWIIISQVILAIATMLKQGSIIVFWLGIIGIVISICLLASIIDYCRIYILKVIKGR